MKKFLCLLTSFLCIVLVLCGCNQTNDSKDSETQKQIEKYLEDGKFQDAYDEANTSKDKDKIIAENFLAYTCYDITTVTDYELELISASFGKVEANENDTYTPNDDMLTIYDYKKLAEYISFLVGEDVLSEYYYGLIEIKLNNDYTKYCLASIKISNGSYNLQYVWDTLKEEYNDTSAIDLYKYVANQLQENGTKLDKKAIKRINENYFTDSPKSIEFEFDLK